MFGVQDVAVRLGRPVEDIADAYWAEQEVQDLTCTRTNESSRALYEALVRRVSRNLAMRNLPLGVVMDETGGTRLGSSDPEVRRLEAPFRKVVLG